MSTSSSPDTAITGASVPDAPITPPAPLGDARFELARQYLSGNGLEIGALHLAMLLPPGARARYVDRMSVPELRQHYPELADLDLAPVDVIDDGERLETVEPESQDFIVANHFFEHCQDPIGTLQTHLSKLRPGGVLFYAIPDKRYTFDYARPVTTLQHLIDDHEQGSARSRSQHYLEWTEALLVDEFEPQSRQDIVDKAAEIDREDYSIHFHVWTEAELVEFFFYCQERLGSFEVEAIRRHWIENIFVLSKLGDAPDREAETKAPADDQVRPPNVTTPIRRVAVPLAGLRVRLDHGSARAHWSVAADGIDARVWVIRAEGPVTVPLVLDRPMTLTARAQLLPHDWRDSVGGVDAWIAVTSAERQVVWRSPLTPAMDPAGVAVEVQLPPGATELQIGAGQRTPPTARTTGQFALVEPHLFGSGVEPSPPRRRRPARATPTDGPLISVLCPVHDPPVRMVEAAIDSVLAQTYRNWELMLVDDGSVDAAVTAALDRGAATDRRIQLIRRPQAGGISVATNVAMEQASGDYIALLDHDDLLHAEALAHVADRLVHDPTLDVVYTDEAVVEDGRIIVWHFKADWSPETIAATMYITHLGVYRRSLALELGGFRSQYDGTQDYDFVLRLGDRTDRIAHLPEVLYYWRAHGRSTAGGVQAKPYAYAIQPGTIAEHLERRGIDAEVQYGQRPGVHRIVHRVDPADDISIIVAVNNMGALPEAAGSWAAQPHRNWDVVVSAPGDQIEMAATALRQWGVSSSRIVLLESDRDDDPTTALHAAAGHARARNLLLMRSPLLGITHDWLARLLGYCSQPGIAAATPVVLTDDNRIAHAGIAMPDGLPLPLLHGLPGAGAPALSTDVVAAEGVIAVSTTTFERLGGLDPRMGSVALADLCLRAGDELGLRTVVVSDARMRAIDPDRATNDLPRLWELGSRYAAGHDHDPYYNPNFRADRGDYQMPPLPEERIE